ncbi:uncharacterized protein TRIVIDRAFT_29730 [Trichoderma virens Gv29-8]|uniref:Zn(2)-C6 fungal-type domain-containing protein n=1 Tax=Hypocrea virens (strain Gv29-8 / FGSC 10586) TaxID=413071 RepID=G9MT60_HYPVG|nr:uncharacterized protein TRIVIDRAFT_29730 [Trichoderma virens Gv29-8]EHK23102.1 hypothetical protein TRIVIDRAFT_29730 [Trichoderma virens Gv29-8]
MPGVPSYRGCDACRKLRKKCDGSTPCSRCKRRNVPCQGTGTVRYKFKTQIQSPNVVGLRQQKMLWQYRPLIWMPIQTPTNGASRLATAFSSLMTAEDPKYNLNCFGDWFTGLPSRFGADQVLDDVADAFLEGLIGIWIHGGRQTVDAMTKYGRALKSLRAALYDPITVKSPHTLCATILFTVSRNWFLNGSDYQVSHIEGIVHLLNASAGEHWAERLDTYMRISMLYPTATIINNSVSIDSWYLKQHGPIFGPSQPPDQDHDQPIESLTLSTILNMPVFLSTPENHLDWIKSSYERLKIEIRLVHQRLNAMTEINDPSALKLDQLHEMVKLESSCIFMLAYTLILSAFLLAFDPENIILHRESRELAWDAVFTSSQTAPHLPVGMGFIPYALFAAWLATDDLDVVKAIRATLVQSDVYFADVKYVRMFRALKQRLRSLRKTKLAASSQIELLLDEHTEQSMPPDMVDFGWDLSTIYALEI